MNVTNIHVIQNDGNSAYIGEKGRIVSVDGYLAVRLYVNDQIKLIIHHPIVRFLDDVIEVTGFLYIIGQPMQKAIMTFMPVRNDHFKTSEHDN